MQSAHLILITQDLEKHQFIILLSNVAVWIFGVILCTDRRSAAIGQYTEATRAHWLQRDTPRFHWIEETRVIKRIVQNLILRLSRSQTSHHFYDRGYIVSEDEQ